MKKTIFITKLMILFTFLGIVIYDIFMATNGFSGDTISEVTLNASFMIGFIPYACGVLMSHLFWQDNTPKRKHLPAIKLISILVGAGLIFSVIQYFTNITPFIFFMCGIPFGKIFWFQHKQ